MSDHNGHHGEVVIDEILSLAVPHGWLMTSIAAVGEVRLGRQRSPKNRSADHPTKYLRAANITWSGIDVSDVLDMEFRPAELETYRLHPGDVLLSEASGSASEVGKPTIWNSELEECCFQNTVIRFRPKAVDSRFALVTFQHFARNAVFSRVSKGVGIHHLSADRFASMPFLLPPQNEQRRIVEKVEELFSDLAAGVAALERAKANLKRYRASVLKAAVEGDLTAEWRATNPNVEPASKLLERILQERHRKWEADQLAKFAAAGKQPPKNWKAKYVEATAPDTTDLPGLPEGWCWATMPQLGTLDRGRSRHRPRNARHLYGGPYPFVQTGNIRHAETFVRDYEQTYSEAGLAQSKLWPAGTLCITIAANIAETAILAFDACFPDSVVGFLPDSTQVSVRFVELFLRTMQQRLEAYAPATAQKNINLETLAEVAIPLPPFAEQEQIVSEADARLSVAIAAENEIERSQTRAARLRQSILKQAFEGRLVPQDPSDEPATVLLERLSTAQNARHPHHIGHSARR